MHTTFLGLIAIAAVASAQGYAPQYVPCPTSNSTFLRQSGAGAPNGSGNQTLNSEETAYIQARHALVPAELQNWLGNSSDTVYAGSLANLNSSDVPNIAIALSGGGDRAALYGAAVLAALDSRNNQSKLGGTGGLLQSASYVSALSGGSWLLTSFVFNDMPQPFDMVLGNNGQDGWNIDYDLFSPSATNTTATSLYLAQLFRDVGRKFAAGFPVTLADIWARALSYHFLPGTNKLNFFDNSTDHGASYRWSNVTAIPSYQNRTMPFPIIVAAVDSPNSMEMPLTGEAVPLQNVVYEFTPLEFGSFDPELQAFMPMELLGTAANAGTPVPAPGQNLTCVEGFDGADFVTSTSSLIFHAYNLSKSVVWTSPASPVNVLVSTVNSTFPQPGQQLDISAVPNPFQGVQTASFEDANQSQLRLLDGGLAGEVDPIAPLSAPARQIDMIIVADATADSDQNMPTGASMVATEARSLLLPNGSLSLPPLPNSAQTFINLGLNTRPTFFGCEAAPANITAATASPYPLIVYVANYDPTGNTNTSTGQTQYNVSQQVAFLNAAYNVATQSNSTAWGICLQCASIERLRARQGLNRTSACDTCFTQHCWNGTEAISNTGNGTSGGNATGSAGGSGSTNGTTAGGTGSTGSSGSGGSKSSATTMSAFSGAVSGLVAVGLGLLVL